MDDERALLARAASGDRSAFDTLVRPELPKLRGFLLRLVANPDDADDLVQETTLQAFRKLADFRGDAKFGTWLISIGARLGLTHLRTRKRWATTTQLEMHEIAHESESFRSDLGAAIGHPDFRYEVAEHVGYCFACVGRALDPEESAAVLLSEVFELANAEAAAMLGLSESTYRHRLASGRRTMSEAFEGLCALVNKRGACHQCSMLRDICPPDRRGREVERFGDVDDPADDRDARFARRLAVVRRGDFSEGTTAGVHAVMLRFIAKNVD